MGALRSSAMPCLEITGGQRSSEEALTSSNTLPARKHYGARGDLVRRRFSPYLNSAARQFVHPITAIADLGRSSRRCAALFSQSTPLRIESSRRTWVGNREVAEMTSLANKTITQTSSKLAYLVGEVVSFRSWTR